MLGVDICKLFSTNPQLCATNPNSSTTHNGSEHKRGSLLSTPIKSPWIFLCLKYTKELKRIFGFEFESF